MTPPHRNDRPIVRTTRGRVRGIWREGSAVFLGIPFAAPPVGDLRFAAPQPHPAWSGVREADRFGATPQRRPFAPETTVPEPSIPGDSTLNVNVFTPVPGDTAAGLPVMVWIHGGGFFAGSPASPWYDGRQFNRDGVVVVTISYRLGFDGFGWIEDAPANRGILDQIAALEWVQENIAEFGGDPHRVTIGGQSAGGASVFTLLATHRAQPLFQGAIAQSGVAISRSLASAREIGRRFAADLGVNPVSREWRLRSEDEILDAQPGSQPVDATNVDPIAEAVAAVRRVVSGVDSELAFIPYVDGELIASDVGDALRAGIGSDKPVLLGATAHEFTLTMMPLRDELRDHDGVALLTRAGLSREIAERYVAQFPELDAALLLGQVLTEYWFRVPLLDIVAARTTQSSGAGTFLYDYRWRSPIHGLAVHCHDLPFTWDLLDAEGVSQALGETPPQGLADEMHATWVDFLRDGDPGWNACSAEGRPGMVFDTRSRLSPDPYSFESDPTRGS